MSSTAAGTPIPAAVEGCARAFLSLAEHLRQSTRFAEQVSAEAILDEFDRFKLWAGNIAAHRKGRRSLEYRLRDAAQLKDETSALLASLMKALNHSSGIVEEKRTPWDEETYSDSDSNSDNGNSSNLQGNTELKQLFAGMQSAITSLMRLSMAIQEPAPNRQARSIDKSHFEKHDVFHVSAKFPVAPQYLADRLGRAISSRRQYLTYREQHHDKLSKGIDKLGRDAARSEFTTNSTEATRFRRTDSLDIMDDGDDTASMTSYATSVNASLRAPNLPKEAREKEHYNCPLCYALVAIRTTAAWKRHIYQDLHPYCCTHEVCASADRLYDSRHAWFAHETEAHRSTFQCIEGCLEVFGAVEGFEDHVRSRHEDLAAPSMFSALKRTSLRGSPLTEMKTCRLCSKRMTLRALQKHLGHHQEQLALFALPSNLDETEDNSDGEEQGSWLGGASINEEDDEDLTDASDTSDIEDTVNDDDAETLRNSGADPEGEASNRYPEVVSPPIVDNNAKEGEKEAERNLVQAQAKREEPAKIAETAEQAAVNAYYMKNAKGEGVHRDPDIVPDLALDDEAIEWYSLEAEHIVAEAQAKREERARPSRAAEQAAIDTYNNMKYEEEEKAAREREGLIASFEQKDGGEAAVSAQGKVEKEAAKITPQEAYAEFIDVLNHQSTSTEAAKGETAARDIGDIEEQAMAIDNDSLRIQIGDEAEGESEMVEAERERVIYEYERKKVLDAEKDKKEREELLRRTELKGKVQGNKDKQEYEEEEYEASAGELIQGPQALKGKVTASEAVGRETFDVTKKQDLAQARETERKLIIAEAQAQRLEAERLAQARDQAEIDGYNKRKAEEEAATKAKHKRLIYEYESRKALHAAQGREDREELLRQIELMKGIQENKDREEYEGFVSKLTQKKLDEDVRKAKEEEELEAAMRKRLSQFGFEDTQIEAMVHPEKQKSLERQSSDGLTPHNPLRIAPQPTYAKINKQHLDIETLHYYDIPYEFDQDPNYIIVLREMTQKETDILFEHTRRLRSNRGDRLFIEADGRERRGKKEYAFVRRKSSSGSGEDVTKPAKNVKLGDTFFR